MNLHFILTLLAFVTLVNAGFHEECHETLREGRLRIESVAESLAAREIDRLLSVLSDSKHRIKTFKPERVSLSPAFQEMIQIRDGQPPCPQPNSTMFTTTGPTTTTKAATTTGPSTTGPADSSSAPPSFSAVPPSSSAVPPSSSAAPSSSSAAPLPDPTPEEKETEKKFEPVRLHAKISKDEDPFQWYMKTLHFYMGRESEVCNNQLTDLNSVTEDQLFGYFSTLAAAHPGPFCSLCHRFTEEVHARVLRPNRLLTTDDEFHVSSLFYSQIPSPRALCTAIAPGCDEDYALKVGNLTESVVCLECTACMSITNVLHHKILLQPKMLDAVYYWLRGNLFHNLCAELCLAFQPYNVTLFPHGFTYDGCQNVMKSKFYQLAEVATVITRPERFCSLELQWCELNEQPNAIHCLREMCQEYFKDTPQTRWLCSQIPDRPAQADAFLNIRQTKVRKEKREYHFEFEQRNLHDEL
ncbi:unnamed protein product [Caenorhabditis sp. 36 PRJEB53466]|nr:unnamed protein product [Caenorhabditis sp. 36 PRJEB53466]